MTCQELIALLAEYLDATLGAEVLARLEAHLAECDECQAYLATYRKTASLAGAAGRVEMPPELQRRITAFLLEQLRARERG